MVLFTGLLGGCQSSEDEYEKAVVPKSYSFEGKVDPRFAGDWKSADGTSALHLSQDGALTIETTTRSVAGQNVAKVTGNWASQSDQLSFRYNNSSGGEVVLRYRAKLAEPKLTLQPEGGKIATLYQRKK